MPCLSQPLKKCLIMQSNGAHIHDTHFFTKENWNFRRVLFLRVEVWVFWNGKNWCFMLLACHACMGHDLMAKWIQIILIMPSNSFICIQFTFPRRTYGLPTSYSGPPRQFSGPYLEMITLYKFSYISFMHGAICFCLSMHTAHIQCSL